MTYAGSTLCASVNALLNTMHNADDCEPVSSFAARIENLRTVHNRALVDEAQQAELPDSRREPLVEAATRLDRKVDDLIKEHQQALDLLRGLCGLVELVPDQSLRTNHRYVDAVAWLGQHEGVSHGR